MRDTNANQQSAVATFRQLHQSGCFVLPNPWDIGTARYLAHLGFKALATTSSGAAWTQGLGDNGLGLEGVLAHIGEIAAASDIPWTFPDGLVPGLSEHLRAFPSSKLKGAEDFLYWSKEKFGIAPFITVTHVTIVCRSAATCLMTTRDVYSSRYLDASVALAIATDAGGPNTFDLVYDNRSRASALKGGLAGLRRMITERRARGALEDSLKTIKKLLEG
jgi:hypothetical protein